MIKKKLLRHTRIHTQLFILLTLFRFKSKCTSFFFISHILDEIDIDIILH